MPRAFTPSTMSQTFSRSRSLGERQAAPMQNREAPPALAARASASTASRSISFSAFTPVSNLRRRGKKRPVPGATAGLDRKQRGNLDFGRIEIVAVHLRGTKYQFGKWQGKERAHLFPRPVVARHT